MSVAPNIRALKKRVDRFLWDNPSNDSLILRQILFDVFSDFDNFVIFGGMVRDIARGGRSLFKSDVDIVIDAPVAQVDLLASRLCARRNKYGGYRVRILSWDIDFWSLSTSWAGRYVPVESFEDLVATTFFDWDSIAYHVVERRIISSDSYLNPLRSGVIDISFVVNPSIRGSVIKAVERVIEWNIVPGFYLFNLLDHIVDEDVLSYVKSKYLHLDWIDSVEVLKSFIFNRRVEPYSGDFFI